MSFAGFDPQVERGEHGLDSSLTFVEGKDAVLILAC